MPCSYCVLRNGKSDATTTCVHCQVVPQARRQQCATISPSPLDPLTELELENADWRRKNRELEGRVSRLQRENNELRAYHAEPNGTLTSSLTVIKTEIDKAMHRMESDPKASCKELEQSTVSS